jgi:hypothetical protein
VYVTVKNGTRAGWRIVRSARTRDWKCPSCSAKNRYYWTRCPVCKHPRPEDV